MWQPILMWHARYLGFYTEQESTEYWWRSDGVHEIASLWCVFLTRFFFTPYKPFAMKQCSWNLLWEHGSLLYGLLMPTAQNPCKKELQKFYNVGHLPAISRNHAFVSGKLFRKFYLADNFNRVDLFSRYWIAKQLCILSRPVSGWILHFEVLTFTVFYFTPKKTLN